MIKKLFIKLFDRIKSIFLKGILVMLPIAITAYLFNVIFKFVKVAAFPIRKIVPDFLNNIPHSEILFGLIIIFIIGFIYKVFLLKRFEHLFENLIFRIPLVKPVYSGIKQLVHAFTSKDKMSFNRVVLAEFPNKGSYCIGFFTGECPEYISPNKDEKYYNVYIPTTPNPTTGFFILMPAEKVIFTDISRQDAMTIIISGGLIKPENINKATDTE